MTRQGLDRRPTSINYCDHHSGTLASSPTQLNPYKLGIELFRDIEDRWNRGAFGKEYDDCDDYARRRDWNTDSRPGPREDLRGPPIHNDLTFIDEFLTLDFVREHKLFTFGYNQSTEYYEIESREFPKVKQQLLFEPDESSAGRYRRARRQLQEPRRAVPRAHVHRRRAATRLRPRHARESAAAVEPAGAFGNRAGGYRTVISFDGTEHEIEKGEPIELAEGAHI